MVLCNGMIWCLWHMFISHSENSKQMELAVHFWLMHIRC